MLRFSTQQWYHTTRLILNRPFIPNNQIVSTSKGDKSAYNLCTDAADNIVTVVTTLEHTHGIFRCSYNVLFTSVHGDQLRHAFND